MAGKSIRTVACHDRYLTRRRVCAAPALVGVKVDRSKEMPQLMAEGPDRKRRRIVHHFPDLDIAARQGYAVRRIGRADIKRMIARTS